MNILEVVTPLSIYQYGWVPFSGYITYREKNVDLTKTSDIPLWVIEYRNYFTRETTKLETSPKQTILKSPNI